MGLHGEILLKTNVFDAIVQTCDLDCPIRIERAKRILQSGDRFLQKTSRTNSILRELLPHSPGRRHFQNSPISLISIPANGDSLKHPGCNRDGEGRAPTTSSHASIWRRQSGDALDGDGCGSKWIDGDALDMDGSHGDWLDGDGLDTGRALDTDAMDDDGCDGLDGLDIDGLDGDGLAG